jgi:Uncharacterized conserved protein
MTIQIVPYHADWPQEFLGFGRRLRAALGENALRIDHIGSTSVPGLAAKDVIDMQITVAEFDPAIAAAIQQAGFDRVEHIHCDHIPPGASTDPAEWTKWIFNAAPPQRRVNLHVRQQGRANQRYPLLFRDYLRAHPEAAEAYRKIKVALATADPEDVEAYYDVKDPVCDLIIGAAELWASATNWRLGPPDC